MATPIINTNLGKVVTATGNIADDLSTLRPLLRNMIFNAFPTDKITNEPIASFPDGADNVPMKSATFAITPVQDLHGYDAPWPAGGGKNLLNADGVSVMVIAGESSFTNIATVQMVQGQTYMISCYQSANIPTSTRNTMGVALNGSYYYNSSSTDANPNAGRQSWEFTAPSTGEATIRYWYNTPSATATIDRFMVNAGSTLEDYSPYSNICPISGWTGAKIPHGGENLAAVFIDGYVPSTSTGQLVQANGARSNFIPIEASTDYIFDATTPTSAARYIFWYDADKHFISYNTNEPTVIATSPANAAFAMLRISVVTNMTQVTSRAFNKGTTATTDAPPTITNITWQDEAGTVYGGTLQYLGGDAWRLTKTMESVDMGTFTWGYFADKGCFGVHNLPMNYGVASQLSPVLCSQYKTENTVNYTYWQIRPDKSIFTSPADSYLVVRDLSYTDAATFKTAVTGQQLVYELATPVVYDLTGEELATTLGTNNVFSNTGDVTELVYRADTALYIEKKLAE